jgi:hypothetical protein
MGGPSEWASPRELIENLARHCEVRGWDRAVLAGMGTMMTERQLNGLCAHVLIRGWHTREWCRWLADEAWKPTVPTSKRLVRALELAGAEVKS